MSDNFLSQLVTSPSRSNNILDLLLTNNPDIVLSVAISDNLPGTDHSAVWFTVSRSVSSRLKVLYNYSKADFNHFSSLSSHLPWDIIDFGSDIDGSWSM